MHIVGVDTGGTFTDFIYKDGSDWGVYKTLSTPTDPSQAVLDGLEVIASRLEKKEYRYVTHGSTVSTNAILERKGVPTALITTDGFQDVIRIGRQNRSRLYDLAYRKGAPIVLPEHCFGIPGRIDNQGNEIVPFDEDAALRVAHKIQAIGVESVAVCFLFSFANPTHEQRMREILAPLGLPVSLSHEIVNEFREFERTSTTVVNAYVSPKMSLYLSRLQTYLSNDVLRIMQSNGGSISAETAMQQSVRTILSGPAGGVVGALEMGRLASKKKLITFDMGGTSTDVALIDGQPRLTLEATISGYPVKAPMIDIHTVGAGGGSLARLDAGGALVVGPESAGADPGPICYGKGRELTVTDANVYLGRLIPDHFLGGEMILDTAAVDVAMNTLAAQAKIDPVELAEGILAVANANMERAIRVISVERGLDPREFTLFSFGGAGGMHCLFLAKLLAMPEVLIPKNSGILSAVGMVLADVIKDYSHTIMCDAATTCHADLEEAFAPLVELGRQDLEAEGFDPDAIQIEKILDMRYHGQSFEILIPYTDGTVLQEAFESVHQSRYGYIHPGKPIEVVNVRLRARGVPDKPTFPKTALAGDQPDTKAIVAIRQAVFDGVRQDVTVLKREDLLPGNVITGPAILVEYSSTLVIPPKTVGRVDTYGNIMCTFV